MAKYYDFKSNYCAGIMWNNTTDINDCLIQIEFNRTLPYFTVNNTNYMQYPVTSPESFYIDRNISNNAIIFVFHGELFIFWATILTFSYLNMGGQ